MTVMDENDRKRAGSLGDVGEGTKRMAVESPARAALQVVKEQVDPTSLPLPSNVQAEAALLGALLWNGTFGQNALTPALVSDLVTPDRFFTPAHQEIFRAMRELESSSPPLPADLTSVQTKLVEARARVPAGYLDQLVAGAAPATEGTIRDHAEAILETSICRDIIATSRTLDQMAKAGKRSDFILATASKQLTEIAEATGRASDVVPMGVPLDSVLRRAASPMTGDVYPTRIPELDDLLLGGLRRRQVMILAARTSVGKSAMALQLATAIVDPSPELAVLYVSLEMGDEQFMVRLLASRTSIDAGDIVTGNVSRDDLFRLKQAAHGLPRDRLFFNTKQSKTFEQIKTMAGKLAGHLARQGKKLAAVVIDHLGIVKPSGRFPTREQEVAANSRGLRALAGDVDCHVIALVQISREAERQSGKDKMPQLYHLKGSGAVEDDADIVALLHRPRGKGGLFKQDEPAQLAVAKARDARLGRVWLAYEPQFLRFSPWNGSAQARALGARVQEEEEIND